MYYVIEREQIKEDTCEMSLTEWDALIDAMEDDELLSDYWDRDGSFDEEIKKRREKENSMAVLIYPNERYRTMLKSLL